MSQEAINDSCVRVDLSISEQALNQPQLQKGVGSDGMVPLSKVHSRKDPAKCMTKEEHYSFMNAHPLKNFEDIVVQYQQIDREIIEKVVEGFECLKEAYHLYGLERAFNVPPKLKQQNFAGVVSYYNKYGAQLRANRVLDWRLQSAITKALDYLIESQDHSLWVSYFKYKTCAFFAYYEGQEIPPAPAGLTNDRPDVLIYPTFVSYLKRVSAKDKAAPRKLFRSFLMTINQSKMGMPRDVKSSIKKAEEKCAKHLTTQPPALVDKTLRLRRNVIVGGKSHLTKEEIDFHELTEIVVSKETVCDQLKRTVREMFHEVCYTSEHHYEPFYPSTSSNYNRTRGAMGAVGEVMKFIYEDDDLNKFLDRELIKMSISPVVFREEISKRYGDRGQSEQLEIDPDHETIGNAIDFDDTEFKEVWVKMFDRLFERAYIEEPYVTPLGLLEALKIRVISKGPPFLYTVLKPLQKFLWGVLKRNSVFQLIGTPISVDLINQVMGEPDEKEVIVNGDYKASTDNLHSWVSECLANELCDVLNENSLRKRQDDPEFPYFRITGRHREMLIRSLIHHKFEVDGEWKDQLEGQLMGSITSFPFLCMANAAFCRWSLEISNKQVYRLADRHQPGTRRAPLLINGDDCTLKGNRIFLRYCWEEITSFGGLTSSVGKTFFSLPERPICMINSVAFDYNFESHLWEERKYINMGILLGKKRSTGLAGAIDDDQVSYGELGCLHRELFRQSPPEIWPRVSQRFIYYNANTLKQCPNIPWDMPEYLGGPGLVPNKPHSERDLRCATLLKMNMKSDGTFHNKRLAVQKFTSTQDWILHQVVKDRVLPWAKSVGGEANYLSLRNFNAYEYGLKDLDDLDIYDEWTTQMNHNCPWESLEDNWSKLYKYLVVETLFRNHTDDVYQSAFDRWIAEFNDKHFFGRKSKKAYKEHSESREFQILKMNMRAWQYVEQDIWNLDSVVVMKNHEVAYEKKTFVIPVTSYSIEKEFYTDLQNLHSVVKELTL